MTTFSVVSKVPTAYQYNSICKLMGWADKNWDGSFESIEEFDTEADAKAWMEERVDHLYNEGRIDYDERDDMIDDIVRCGSMSYDAAHASIQRNEG